MSILTSNPNVVLSLPIGSIPALISRSTTVVNTMTENKATFPTPSPALAAVSGAITTLTNTEASFRAHTGTRGDRDAAKANLIDLMRQLRGYVQSAVAADPKNADTIAQNAAMTLRKRAARTKSELSVKQPASGIVHVYAKALKGAKANDFAYSTDGGKTWNAVPTSTRANAVITGLQPGTQVMYRHRAITKAGPGDWGQPITAVVT